MRSGCCSSGIPELHGRVGMLALLAPSRQDIPEYAEYVAADRGGGARGERAFGRDGWQPVELDVADDFLRSVAGYKQFDVLLVNPVFDGLNLVAKEASSSTSATACSSCRRTPARTRSSANGR